MIENRIKRALWAVTILIALGFGGQSAYHLYDAYITHAEGRIYEGCPEYYGYPEWCTARAEEDFQIRYQATGEAIQSLVIAVGTPIALWTLFFLLRWIWTGRIRNSQSPVAEKRPFVTKQVLYWGLGILGCVLLFVVNVLVLPSGRAVHVFISTAVQGIGLVLVAWIVTKAREARRKRAEQEHAAQPVAAVDPPRASSH